MIADENSEGAKIKGILPKQQLKKDTSVSLEKEDDSKYDSISKPKVGFEYRYSRKYFQEKYHLL